MCPLLLFSGGVFPLLALVTELRALYADYFQNRILEGGQGKVWLFVCFVMTNGWCGLVDMCIQTGYWPTVEKFIHNASEMMVFWSMMYNIYSVCIGVFMGFLDGRM